MMLHTVRNMRHASLVHVGRAERLAAYGYSHGIPVYNTVGDQADALVAWSHEFAAGRKNEFAQRPLFAVQSTAPVIDIVEGVTAVLPLETVITRVDLDERPPNGARRSKNRNEHDAGFHRKPGRSGMTAALPPAARRRDPRAIDAFITALTLSPF